MKLISLNIWGGQVLNPLKTFISLHKDTDIFCFQEVYKTENPKDFVKVIMNAPNSQSDIYYQIQDILTSHNGYFAATQNTYGLSIFIKKTIQVSNVGDVFVYKWKDAMINNDPATEGKNLEYVEFNKNNKDFMVCSFHGLWTGKDKKDSEDRILQSENVKKFLDSKKAAKIIVGDFNLNPDTKSVSILEQNMKNLIKEYKITSTRSRLYDRFELGDRHANYAFVSNGVKVLDFKALQDEVSDHLPLYLEFE
jgi:endonuclease/exonuclease/phosphatase family metal-dependent hydrolase